LEKVKEKKGYFSDSINRMLSDKILIIQDQIILLLVASLNDFFRTFVDSYSGCQVLKNQKHI